MQIRHVLRGRRYLKTAFDTTNQVRNYSFWNKVTSLFWNETNTATDDKKPVELMEKAFDDHTPSWFRQEQRARQKVQRETTGKVLNKEEFDALLLQANQNLHNWSQKKKTVPQHVEVVRGDWGAVAQRITQTYGEIYGVLNMANAYFFGGDFLGGGSAQEENMYERTSCSNHILEESDSIYVDEGFAYRYKQKMSDLINAKTLMTSEELMKLSTIRGTIIDRAYKIHMDTVEPEVCFRGPELFANPQGLTLFDESKSGPIPLSVEDGSFAFLKDHEIFPFHEVRSAALDLTDSNINVNWEDKDFVSWFRAETKRRIDAQLDTLLLNGIRHAVLCAFGCGAFKNKAEIVASIYQESIKERAEHFDHIVFAIYYPGYGRDNFHPFANELHGMPLGQNALAEISSIKFKRE